MKTVHSVLIVLFSIYTAQAQMDLPPIGGNPRAILSEEVGITGITLTYSRPDVSGREGKIWGTLVPYGFSTFSFITNGNTAPWRAGANENTTIQFEHEVLVEGRPVPAGTYGIHMAVWPDSVMLIFSSQHDAWGSFYYEEKNDVLRVIVKPLKNDQHVEWLKYEFIDHKSNRCTLALFWEKWIIPFKIEVDVENIVLTRLREQVTSQKGFNSNNLIQAAQYCLNNNINLEEALLWSQRAVNGFQGQRSYFSLRNLAAVFEKLNRMAEADSVMTEALTMATAAQYTSYSRTLITQKRTGRALDILQASMQKHGDIYLVNLGFMFVYSAKGDFENALKYGNKALAQAASPGARTQLESNLTRLRENKDIN
jgi:hypothetical protein